MSEINIILISLGLFGMLPLTFILYGRHRAQNILDKGMMAKARVYQVYSSIRLGSVVSYTFYNEQRQQFYGRLHCKLGLYKVNDVIDIFYLQKNPKRNVPQGAWKSPVLIVFGVVIAVFIWFAVYKLYQMVQSGTL